MSTKIIREYYSCNSSEQAHWRDAIEQARMDGYDAVYISTDHIGLYEKYGAVFMENSKDLWGGNTRIYRLDF